MDSLKQMIRICFKIFKNQSKSFTRIFQAWIILLKTENAEINKYQILFFSNKDVKHLQFFYCDLKNKSSFDFFSFFVWSFFGDFILFTSPKYLSMDFPVTKSVNKKKKLSTRPLAFHLFKKCSKSKKILSFNLNKPCKVFFKQTF